MSGKDNVKHDKNSDKLKIISRSKENMKSGLKKIEPHIETIGSMFRIIAVIIAGTFVWLISSFDKFIVDGQMPMKMLYFSGLTLIGIALLLIGLCVISVWFVKLGILHFLKNMYTIEAELEPLEAEDKTNEDKVDKNFGILSDSFESFKKNLDKMKSNPPPIRAAIIAYGIGILLIFIYVTIFISTYL